MWIPRNKAQSQANFLHFRIRMLRHDVWLSLFACVLFSLLLSSF